MQFLTSTGNGFMVVGPLVVLLVRLYRGADRPAP
jgi:hypothetical protein